MDHTAHSRGHKTNGDYTQQSREKRKRKTNRFKQSGSQLRYAHIIIRHLRKTTNTQMQEAQTTSICPLCNQNYKSSRNCQDHITKVCGPKATPQTIHLLQVQLTKAQAEQEARARNSTGTNLSSQPVTITPNIPTILSRTQQRPVAQVKRIAT